jgi:hypothetical protein
MYLRDFVKLCTSVQSAVGNTKKDATKYPGRFNNPDDLIDCKVYIA